MPDDRLYRADLPAHRLARSQIARSATCANSKLGFSLGAGTSVALVLPRSAQKARCPAVLPGDADPAQQLADAHPDEVQAAASRQQRLATATESGAPARRTDRPAVATREFSVSASLIDRVDTHNRPQTSYSEAHCVVAVHAVRLNARCMAARARRVLRLRRSAAAAHPHPAASSPTAWRDHFHSNCRSHRP
eukprot:scaffold3460_cov115-Isochrysis_galbana.AAC.9